MGGLHEKHARSLRRSRDDFLLFGCFQAACFFWPFIAIFLVPAPLRWVVGLQIGIIFFIRFLLAARFLTSWFGAVLHPLGVLLMMLIGLNSWRHSHGRGVVWKGRTYKPEI